MKARGLHALPALLGGFAAWMARRGSGSDKMSPVTIELGAMRLTIMRRNDPSAKNAWCRNALLAEAQCKAQQRELRATGALLSAVDLQAWHGKLPAFVAGDGGELHLCCDGDCLGLLLERPVHDDMTAVTVVLLDPAERETLHSWPARERNSLLFLVTQGQLEDFRDGVERAMRAFPVYPGHV